MCIYDICMYGEESGARKAEVYALHYATDQIKK